MSSHQPGRGGGGMGRGAPPGGRGGGGPGGRPLPRGPVGYSTQRGIHSQHRLYVGNMDPRMSEGAVLKLFKQFGNMTRCDYLWHVSGPKRGQPRGFCFVEFETREEAEKAKLHTSGKYICGKPLVVHFAEEKVEVKNDAPVEVLKSKLASGVMGAGGSTEKRSEVAAPVVMSGGGGGGKSAVVSPAVLAQALRAKLAQMDSEKGG